MLFHFANFFRTKRTVFSRVVQPHPNFWRFVQCLKQEESVISHRMVQTDLEFTSTKSTRIAARKTKQISKFINLLQSNKRSLFETLMSLGYLVGEAACRGQKRKNKAE